MRSFRSGHSFEEPQRVPGALLSPRSLLQKREGTLHWFAAIEKEAQRGMGPARRRGGGGSGPAPKARASRGETAGTRSPLARHRALGWGGVGGSIS